MSGTPEHRALLGRLRADLTKAEEEFRQATTPELKQQALERFEEALARFSKVMLADWPKSSAGTP
jgi:hypothetical protein